MPYYTRAMVIYMREQAKLAKEQGGAGTSKKVSPSESAGKQLSKKESAANSTSPGATPASGSPGRGGGSGYGAAAAISGATAKKGNLKAGEADSQGRLLRVTPSCVDDDPNTGVNNFNLEKDHPNNLPAEMTFDEKRLMYMKSLLRLQVERIHRTEGAILSKEFGKFQVDKQQDPVRTTSKCVMYKARHLEFMEVDMVAKVYTQIEQKVPNPIYLKVLRHLGKKHPFIVATWEIFLDEQEQCTYVFQEYANRQDMAAYLAKNTKPLSEVQVCEWARQLFKALDYLGDMGICHRAIKPKNVLLNHKDLGIKLSGFYDSVIYWNVKTEDISNIPCIPLAKKNRQLPDFQAPEVHGRADREEFDPILADVWSYSAVVYFAATQGNYPYNFRKDNPRLESEIQANVAKVNLSEEGKRLLSQLLNTNALARMAFNKICHQPWFSKFRKDNLLSSSQKLA